MESPHTPLLCVNDFNSYLTDLNYFVTEIVQKSSFTLLPTPINLLLFDHCAQWFLHSSSLPLLSSLPSFRQVIMMSSTRCLMPSLELIRKDSSGLLPRIFSFFHRWFPLHSQSQVSPLSLSISHTLTDTVFLCSVFLSIHSPLLLHSSFSLLFLLSIHAHLSCTLPPLSSSSHPTTAEGSSLEVLE